MGEVRNGDQKVRKYLFSEIFYGRQTVSYEDFFQELFGLEGSKNFLDKFRQVHNLKISDHLLRSESFFQKNIPGFICSLCVCVFSSRSFWTSMDVPAGVTQEEGNTGFSIHLLSAVLALIFLARRIQPFLSLVDREVEFCVLTI